MISISRCRLLTHCALNSVCASAVEGLCAVVSCLRFCSFVAKVTLLLKNMQIQNTVCWVVAFCFWKGQKRCCSRSGHCSRDRLPCWVKEATTCPLGQRGPSQMRGVEDEQSLRAATPPCSCADVHRTGQDSPYPLSWLSAGSSRRRSMPSAGIQPPEKRQWLRHKTLHLRAEAPTPRR